MPVMESERKVTLSLVKFITEELTASGWSSVSIVPNFPKDDRQIVLSGVTTSGVVVLPALTIMNQGGIEGRRTGVGSTVRERNMFFSIVLYAASDGQEVDLRNFLAKQLYNGHIYYYDFSAGFTGDGSETRVSLIDISSINHRPVYDFYNENPALHYGGLISFTVKVEDV